MKNLESILLLTKDAQCKSYYPCYGNTYYKGKTPNMDELCSKGTLFNRCYTVAPSSAMSYLGMFTGKYPYELPFKKYTKIEHPYEGETLFDKAYSLGYEPHVVWDEHWYEMAFVYSNCYGKNTKIHYIKNLRQGVGPKYQHKNPLERNDQLASITLENFKKEIHTITSGNKKQFIWVHLPHVLNGRTGYASDVDLYDRYIGVLREFFDDNNIFISADHGNMNGLKGKLRYGFDVYEPAINIPLITPRIDGMSTCDNIIVNKDFFDLIFNRKIHENEIIFVDSAYYEQLHRKIAVIYNKYRYIFNKENGSEELYDIEWDPNQNFNLISDYYDDKDRHTSSLSRELIFYTDWDLLPAIRTKLRNTKDSIWRSESTTTRRINKIKAWLGGKSMLSYIILTPLQLLKDIIKRVPVIKKYV